MRKSKTKKMVGTAMLAAIGYLLMFLAFPLIPGFPFMKVDLSEIPILIATYLFGPAAGIMTAFIRSLLHFLTTGGDIGSLIGNVVSFVAAISFVFPVYYLTRRNRSKNGLAFGLIIGTLNMTIVMSLMNYFVTLPLYFKYMMFSLDMPVAKYIAIGVIPFNLLKGLIISLAFIAVHAKLLPWLATKQDISEPESKRL